MFRSLILAVCILGLLAACPAAQATDCPQAIEFIPVRPRLIQVVQPVIVRQQFVQPLVVRQRVVAQVVQPVVVRQQIVQRVVLRQRFFAPRLQLRLRF